MRAIFLLFPFVILLPCPAQGPPPTDIYLAELDPQTFAVGAAVKISEFAGYNNQPAFLGDGDLLYTCIRDGQADIYRYRVADGTTTQMTYTAESEYSPTPIDGDRQFSSVRVEWDNTQRLWRFPIDGGPPSMVLKSVKAVGYHLWLDERRLALFLLGEPNYLAVVSTGDEQPRTLLRHVGRCIKKIPGEAAFSAVVMAPEKPRTIKRIALDDWTISDICTTVEGAEDYAWTPDGTLLMAGGGTLYRYRPGTDSAWVPVAQLQGFGSLSRIAVRADGKRIAMVAGK